MKSFQIMGQVIQFTKLDTVPSHTDIHSSVLAQHLQSGRSRDKQCRFELESLLPMRAS